MYNKELHCWKSEQYEEALLLWCREPFNKENPEAMFVLADALLEKNRKGKQTSEAVYLMEQAAKLGYGRAALAMGQMYQYGWSVSHSRRLSVFWYEQAAALGQQEALQLLAQWKRRRRLQTVAVSAVCGLLVLLGCGLWLLAPRWMPVKGILVHENTELLQTTNLQEFSKALNNLVADFDSPVVVSGQQGTNRLLLQFEGQGIDLSDFPAAMVISNGKNYLVVQFTTEAEAQRCLKLLQQTKGILFVQEDTYQSWTEATVTAGDLASSGVPYTSPYANNTYYSWGVEYMGLDRLAAWVSRQQAKPVTVAVLDTGSEPCPENSHRYQDGFDVVDMTNSHGWTDLDGHGTHVAGTIIDCTWDLDVSILPVRVLAPNGSPESYIVLGLQYAIQSGVDVINMSLGGQCTHTEPDGTCGSAKDHYIRDAVKQGIVVVVAAGNGDAYGNPASTKQECPAHLGDCIVVGACDQTDQLASFTNYGDSVDVCAPGVDVVSYYPGGTFGQLSGTSMATPHISALVAMLKMLMPGKTPAQIEKYITDYCVDMGNEMSYGAGIPWAGYFAGD